MVADPQEFDKHMAGDRHTVRAVRKRGQDSVTPIIGVARVEHTSRLIAKAATGFYAIMEEGVFFFGLHGDDVELGAAKDTAEAKAIAQAHYDKA